MAATSARRLIVAGSVERKYLVGSDCAAFLRAALGIAPEVRPEHAACISPWLSVLKGDKRFIFTAAAQAQRAADYLHSLLPPEQVQPHVAALYETTCMHV